MRAQRKAWRNRNPEKVKAAKALSRANTPPRFVGVDSESIDNSLVMISAADAKGEAWSLVVHQDEEISTHRAFLFLVGLPKNTIKVGFWFEYDVNMMLRDLSREHLERLREEGRCFWGDWSIRHIPGKQFGIKHRPSGRSATVWDFANFVRSSFVKMLRAWEICPESEIAEIESMKDLRGEFDWKMIRRIGRYNENECRLLAQSAIKIWQSAKDAGITLRSYYGGGSIASELMRTNKVLLHSEEWENPLAERGYYGGRFETSVIGLVKGPIWLYDINSAYPYAASQLPSLKGARWIRRRSPRLGLGIHLIKWNVSGMFGPFPVRRRVGSLCYPSQGEGWYWWPEVEAALNLYPKGIEIRKTISLEINDDTKPFDWIEGEAAHRLILKEADDFGHQILKLGLNSVYGKLAQRVGKAPFHNTVWAGLITSQTRAMLLNAIALAPDSILSMATDSIFSTAPLDLPISPALGDWETKKVDWMFFAQGGIYFWPSAEGIVMKSRGFSGRGLTYELVLEEWQLNGMKGVVNVPQRRFIGYRTGLRREGLWRTWMDDNRSLRFDCYPRRVAVNLVDNHCVTRPPNRKEVEFAEMADSLILDENTFPDWMEELEQPEPPYIETII